MNSASPRVIIHEVGLRDGLQMESQTIPTERKLQWLRRLLETGVDIIQVGSFVHPGKVPQMADTDELFRSLAEGDGIPARVTLSALVLNEKGFARAAECGVKMLCLGVSASETHSMKNSGMPVTEATKRIVAIAREATRSGMSVQVSVQSAFGCGFEGAVPEEQVMRIIRSYLDAGLRTISLADTAGHATPDMVKKRFGDILDLDPQVELACHFHNTYGLGLANVWAAYERGVTTFESSVAGLGGCPFTRVAGGNVSTEDMVHMFRRMNVRRDIRLDPLIDLARDVAGFFGREMPGMVYRVGQIK